jgi:hypothetical protein
MRITNYSNLDSDHLSSIERELSGHRSLADLLEWARRQPSGDLDPRVIAGVVTQDEYTHDIIVPWRQGLVLVYDAN